MCVRPKEGSDLGDRRPGAEDLGHTGLAQCGHVVVRDDPANRDEDIVHTAIAEQRRDPWHEGHVRTGQDGQADDVDIFLERGRGDHLGRLSEARVDDLEALVAQPTREHLGAAVVAVEAGLGDQHLERSVSHGAIVAHPTTGSAVAGCRVAGTRVRSSR